VPHVLPESRAWLDQRFSFYDIDPTPAQPSRPYRWVSIAVSDMIDTKNLGYVYDNIAPPPAEPATPEQAEPAAARRTQRPNPTTKKIEMSDQDRRLLSAHEPQKRYILHIDGIRIPSGQSAIVKVFINKPDATRETSAGMRNYVGYFAIVAKNLGGGHTHQPSNVTLDVTEKLAVLLESREPTLTLVPMNQNPDDIHLPYERAYVREE
jgi:hypothetical protein